MNTQVVAFCAGEGHDKQNRNKQLSDIFTYFFFLVLQERFPKELIQRVSWVFTFENIARLQHDKYP